MLYKKGVFDVFTMQSGKIYTISAFSSLFPRGSAKAQTQLNLGWKTVHTPLPDSGAFIFSLAIFLGYQPDTKLGVSKSMLNVKICS